MGDKLKKILFNLFCSLLIFISFVFTFNSYFSNNLNGWILISLLIIFFTISFLLLQKKVDNKFSLKLIKSISVSLLLLFGFIYFDSTFNNFSITNYFLSLKGQSNYVGETRSKYLTILYFSNIYPAILVLSLITSFAIKKRVYK